MLGRQIADQSQLVYLFDLDERIPARHLLRLINPTGTLLAGVREKPTFSNRRAHLREPSQWGGIDPDQTSERDLSYN
jgi:transposase